MVCQMSVKHDEALHVLYTMVNFTLRFFPISISWVKLTLRTSPLVATDIHLEHLRCSKCRPRNYKFHFGKNINLVRFQCLWIAKTSTLDVSNEREKMIWDCVCRIAWWLSHLELPLSSDGHILRTPKFFPRHLEHLWCSKRGRNYITYHFGKKIDVLSVCPSLYIYICTVDVCTCSCSIRI